MVAESTLAWMRADRWRLGFLAAAIASVLFLDAWLLTCGFHGCPSAAEVRTYSPNDGGRVLDRNGKLIGHLTVIRRVNVTLDDIPLHVRQAFVATEDRRFYTHSGIDWRGVARATVRNISALGVREGFSTITMQVARNSFMANRYSGRSPRRKLIELRLARLLERHLTKDQILEHYLNVIYLGNGAYGVEAASRDLFGRSVSRVTLSQAALLAGVTRAPSYYAPRMHPRRARQRRDLVLSLMHDQGFISRAEADQSTRAALRLASNAWKPANVDTYGAMDAVRALVDSVLPHALREGNVVVHTTIDATAQAAADLAIERQARAIEAGSYSGYGEPIQGALVALDPQNGDIRALVGGRKSTRGGFVRALNAKRQPGSAFKPFVYAAALRAGIPPSAKVDDVPVEVAIAGEVPWLPANYDGNYQGRTTVRRALMMSSNAATVRVSRAVTESLVIATAQRNGITSPLRPHPSLALGALEVTPIELVTAYAPFANGGYRVTPRLVTRIESQAGALLWSVEAERTPAMDPRDAYMMNSMLRGVVDHGTARVLRSWGIRGPVGGKTGTTNNGADVWFVGFTPTIVAGVWFGYDSPRQIADRAAGAGYAAPAWAQFYQAGWTDHRDAEWAPPSGMVEAQIDPETGDLATEFCDRKQTEYFKDGMEPREYCQLHLTHDPTIIARRLAGGADVVAELARRIRRFLRF